MGERSQRMRITREHAAAAISAPLMVVGLAGAALADGWPTRIGGMAMVVGASVALAVTGRRARVMGWVLAALGLVAVVAARF